MPDRRTVALVGPSLSGKTSLMESALFIAGAMQRKGSVRDGTSVGDPSPEARNRKSSVEVSVASAAINDVTFTFLDCPGSVDFLAETHHALLAADAALVVVEPVPERALTLAPLLHYLDEHEIPHLLLINKMDRAAPLLRDVLPALQQVSRRPLVMHQVPIRDGEAVTGYVDLASEHAYAYQPGRPSKEINLPDAVREREAAARLEMLEKLADFDDALMETLLEDKQPSVEEIEESFRRDLAEDKIVPVFIGAAEHDHGVRRLLAYMAAMVPAPN